LKLRILVSSKYSNPTYANIMFIGYQNATNVKIVPSQYTTNV